MSDGEPAEKRFLSRMFLRLPPAQKALPAPVSTTAPTVRSRRMRSQTSTNSSIWCSSVSALRSSGRFMERNALTEEHQMLEFVGQRIALLGTVHGERDDGVVTRLEERNA